MILGSIAIRGGQISASGTNLSISRWDTDTDAEKSAPEVAFLSETERLGIFAP